MILGTISKSFCNGDVVYLSRRKSCSWVNSITSNNDVKSIACGIVFTRCWPPLWCHLGARWLSCPNKWLCTWQGLGSKHTLQTFHKSRQMPSMMLKTTRPTSWSSSGVSSLGNLINIVVTPLWVKCEDETHTPKSGNLESSGTLKKLRPRFQGSKHLALGCSLYHWKGIEA
jgi:hypothetical protein